MNIYRIKRIFNKFNIDLYLLLIVLSIAGVILLRYITPKGLGLINDSVGYIAGARNLAAGYGYTRLTGDARHIPITNYPPIYSLALAFVSLSGLEIIRATRLINLFCFAANILLCGSITHLLTGSGLLGVLGASLLLVSEPFLQIHAYALSEPLYLSFSLLMLSFLVIYAVDRTRTVHALRRSMILLVGSGGFACLGYLTRYPGVALYATAFIIIFIFNRTWRMRLRDSAIFLGASLPGVIAWSIRNAIISGNPTNRALSYHPIPWDKIFEGLNNFWAFLLPDKLVQPGMTNTATIWLIAALLLAGALIAVLLVLSIRIMKKDSGTVNFNFTGVIVFGTHALIYLAVLFLTLTFLDASPIFEHRILSPAYISILILIPMTLGWLCKKAAWGKLAAVVLSIALVVSFTIDSLPTIHEFHENGQGYISLRWQRSSVISVAKELPPITLFSNKTQALYLLAEKPAYVLVSPLNPATQSERPDYDATTEVIRQMVLDGEAALVIFDYQNLIRIRENAWMLDLTRDLPVYGDYWDGTIFGRFNQ